ncbi:formimidoylglutamase [Limibacter armeniacum]|uniref:formimidoylglutamase n=1 Tax=Limibacter armeniacum TaxID=466084 RepID=UPI002FE5B5E6
MKNNNYQSTDRKFWDGRIDGTSREDARWHQVIETVNLLEADLPVLKEDEKGIVIIGFMSEEGVRRNKGRLGAIDGPYDLRKSCMNLPVHFPENVKLLDGGNIVCIGEGLEEAQATLGKAVAKVLLAGYKPLVFGGGHEVAYGHYLGLKQYIKEVHPGKKLGIINFDAHFDLRELENGRGSSGTPFLQIARDMQKEGEDFRYLVLGIQKNSNTKKLFNVAEELGVEYVAGRKFNAADRTLIFQKISDFINSVDFVYNTNCLDVFSAAYAPGVSAPAYNGITPDALFVKSFKKIHKSEKVISTDIAELNPKYDTDHRTAKLAASMVFDIVNSL